MNKQLEIFVKCFYVWTKIGLRTLSLAFFFGVGLDFHYKILEWTRSGKNLSPLFSSVSVSERSEPALQIFRRSVHQFSLLAPQFFFFVFSSVIRHFDIPQHRIVTNKIQQQVLLFVVKTAVHFFSPLFSLPNLLEDAKLAEEWEED